jgi:NAD(P)-dependent dehydrogenase (short-subunit alcohol dehydrogenase family)
MANSRIDPCNLAGRKVLVTGGASGIGKAAGALFVGLGADVVLVDVNEAEAVAAAAETGALASVGADVANEQDVEQMIGRR